MEIYKVVLIQPRDIQLLDRGGKIICANTFDGGRRHHILAITNACKIIRQESLPVFFGLNNFFYNSKPDPTVVGRREICHWLDGSDTLVTFRAWLQNIGRTSRVSIKRLTFDLGFWSTLPIAVDVREKWWLAACEGTRLLRNAGLLRACGVSVHLTVQQYPAQHLLYCNEHGSPKAIHQSFDLVLPTANTDQALHVVILKILDLRDQLIHHAWHQHCDLADCWTFTPVLTDVVHIFYTIMRAFGVGVEDIIDQIDLIFSCLEETEGIKTWIRENAASY